MSKTHWQTYRWAPFVQLQEKPTLKKSNSCSTIYLDDSTVSQPNLRSTIKCVTLAIYYHIRDRSGQQRTSDIFDERLHPLSKDPPEMRDPDHRTIYRFVRTLFNAAQLSAECAIITLVYLERLLTYAEMDISPCSWRRVVLGAVLLASKVCLPTVPWSCYSFVDILLATAGKSLCGLQSLWSILIADFKVDQWASLGSISD